LAIAAGIMTQTLYDSFAFVYDLQHRTYLDDVPMYLQLAREHAAQSGILELGAGSGRVMIPLVEAGHRVVGVDESPQMLQLAETQLHASLRAPAESWSLVQADARSLRLDEKFGMAFIALNTFLHNATRDDQLATLGTARHHMHAGGVLILDLPSNDELIYQPNDGEFQIEASMIDPATQAQINKYVASRVFWATQEQELTYRIERRQAANMSEVETQIVTFRLRHVFKHEMELLLLQSGFAAPAWLGAYDLSPYVEGSTRMIAVAKAA
jgi:SAM-dependent methyltransferase